MNKLYAVLLLAGIANTHAYAQDTIVLKTGDMYAGKIQSVDSSRIYFMVNHGNETYTNSVKRSKVSAVKYGSSGAQSTNTAKPGADANAFVLKKDTGRLDGFSFGLGIGLESGGLVGGSVMLYVQRNVGFFCSAGYALIGIGLNGGMRLRAVTKRSKGIFVPYAVGMYGYNTVIVVANADRYSKIYYGFTVGLGFDFKPRPTSKCYYSMSVLMPIRSAQVDEDIDYLKNEVGVEFDQELLPIAVSLGIRFIID